MWPAYLLSLWRELMEVWSKDVTGTISERVKRLKLYSRSSYGSQYCNYCYHLDDTCRCEQCISGQFSRHHRSPRCYHISNLNNDYIHHASAFAGQVDFNSSCKKNFVWSRPPLASSYYRVTGDTNVSKALV